MLVQVLKVLVGVVWRARTLMYRLTLCNVSCYLGLPCLLSATLRISSLGEGRCFE